MDWLRSRSADWRKYRNLSGQERRLLAVSMLLLPVVVLTNRLFGLKRCQRTLNRILPYRARVSCSEPEGARLAHSASRIILIAANRCLCQSTCLQQSILLQRLVAQRGVDTDLRVGVRKRGGIFEAHAWVELRGHIVNGRENVEARFVAFPRHGIAKLSGKT